MKNPNFQMPTRSRLRDVLLVACLLTAKPALHLFIIGLIVFLAGLSLRLWSKGALRRNKELTTTGPYTLCRHPFYLGNLILDVSFCLLAGNLGLMAIYVPLFLVIYRKTMISEEQFLLGRFPETARHYRNLCRLWPRIPNDLSRLRSDWSIRILLKEREVSRLLRLIGIVCFFGWVQLLHFAWWEAFELDGMVLPMATLLLQAGSWVVYAWLERPNRHSLRRKRLAMATLWASATIVGFITADAAQVQGEDLFRLAQRYEAEPVDSLEELLADFNKSPRLILRDDTIEHIDPEILKAVIIKDTFIFDFEAYHVVESRSV